MNATARKAIFVGITPAQRRRIFAVSRELGLDDDTRRAAIKAVCGKSSTTKLTKAEAAKLLNHLTNPTAQKGTARRRLPDGVTRLASKAQLKLIHALAQARINAGFMTAEGLAEWGASPEMLGHWPPRTSKEASRVIEILKSMNRRDGLWGS